MSKLNNTVVENILNQYKRKDGSVSSFYLKRAINKGYNNFVLNENYSLSALQRKAQSIFDDGSKDINSLNEYEKIFFATVLVWGLKKDELVFKHVLKFKPELQKMKDGSNREKWSLKMFLDSLDLFRQSVNGLSEYEKVIQTESKKQAKKESKKPAKVKNVKVTIKESVKPAAKTKKVA